MSVKSRLLRKRHDKERYLRQINEGTLTDNDRLWAAVTAIEDYLEEEDTRRYGLKGGDNE